MRTVDLLQQAWSALRANLVGIKTMMFVIPWSKLLLPTLVRLPTWQRYKGCEIKIGFWIKLRLYVFHVS